MEPSKHQQCTHYSLSFAKIPSPSFSSMSKDNVQWAIRHTVHLKMYLWPQTVNACQKTYYGLFFYYIFMSHSIFWFEKFPDNWSCLSAVISCRMLCRMTGTAALQLSVRTQHDTVSPGHHGLPWSPMWPCVLMNSIDNANYSKNSHTDTIHI